MAESDSEIPTITSVAKFIKWVGKCDSDMLYRGLANEGYEVSSSLYRRLSKSRPPAAISDSIFADVANRLIESAQKEGHDYQDGRELKALELLAKLQHYGAATCLIDFTRNPLVALWFSCQPPAEEPRPESTETPHPEQGKVIAIKTANADKYASIAPIDLQLSDIKTLLTPPENSRAFEKLWFWPPKKQDNRIVAQQSVFVFGKTKIPESEVDQWCVIANKAGILLELQKHGITAESLFCDFAGFAREVNASDKEYREWTAVDYFHFGVFHQQRGELEQAITNYDQAINLNLNDAITYYNRGNAKALLDDYAAAIADYNLSIKLDPKHASAYYNRGHAKADMGDHVAAIEDYNHAIKLNPKHLHVYNNRGNAKARSGDHVAAIEDFNQSINLNPSDAIAYCNRGIARLNLGLYTAAIEDFNEAIKFNLQYALAFHGLGIAKFALHDKAGALANYQRAKEINSQIVIPKELEKEIRGDDS